MEDDPLELPPHFDPERSLSAGLIPCPICGEEVSVVCDPVTLDILANGAIAGVHHSRPGIPLSDEALSLLGLDDDGPKDPPDSP